MVKTIALDVKGGCEAYTAPKGNTVGAWASYGRSLEEDRKGGPSSSTGAQHVGSCSPRRASNGEAYGR